MLNIAITLDYELFFGENKDDAENILFHPTARLIDLLAKDEVASTFFVDVCSVWQHNAYGLYGYSDSFSRQLLDMDEAGQDVQLHIHPHWLKSNYSNGKWIFDTDSYRIHSFGFSHEDENSAYGIIKRGKRYLEDTLCPQNSGYQCIAYRAGGFAIQPYDDLVAALVENGIRIDSSVAMHHVYTGEHMSCNYTDLPESLNWYLTPSMPLSYEGTQNGDGIVEIPIGYLQNKLTRRLLYSRKGMTFRRDRPKGTFLNAGVMNKTMPHKSFMKKVLEYHNTYELLSFDSMNYRIMKEAADIIYNKNNGKTHDATVCIICHPKLVCDETLVNMHRFIMEIKKQPHKFRFTSIRNANVRLARKE
jgi:hypothetical protein